MSHIYRMTDWVTILWMTEDKMTHCLVTARKLTCKRREQSSWSQCWNFCEMSQRQPNTRLQMEVLRELPAELIFEVCRLHVGHKLFRGPEAAHLRNLTLCLFSPSATHLPSGCVLHPGLIFEALKSSRCPSRLVWLDQNPAPWWGDKTPKWQ